MAYVPLRKAVEKLGLHPNTLRRYANEEKIPIIKNEAGQRLYDVEAYIRGAANASLVCYCRVNSSKQKDDLTDKSPICSHSTQKPKSLKISEVDSTLKEKDCEPYWTDFCAEISSRLLLPVATDYADLDSSLYNTWLNKTVEKSWFSTKLFTVLKPNLPPIFSASSTSSLVGCTDDIILLTNANNAVFKTGYIYQ